MKSLLALVLIFSAFVSLGQTTKLKLVSDVWPPFTNVETKYAFALDLVGEALTRANVQSNTEILGFTEAMDGIRSGKFDGSAALWYSLERSQFLLYSEPYLENRLILVGLKGSDVSADSLSQLNGQRVAIVESYEYGALVDGEESMELVAGNSDQQNLDRLLLGEVNYMLVDALLIEYLLKYQSEEAAKFLEIGNKTMVRLPLYLAIRKETMDAENIIKKFNDEIKRMIEDGTYNRILQLNWIATDVDGDGQTEFVLSGNKAGKTEPINSYKVMTSQSQASANNNRYYIEGHVYENWAQVPDKYKVTQNKPSRSKSRSFESKLHF